MRNNKNIIRDNSCEINLLDCFEKNEVHADNFDKSDIPKEREDPAGKYAVKLRKVTAKVFTKKSVWANSKIIEIISNSFII